MMPSKGRLFRRPPWPLIQYILYTQHTQLSRARKSLKIWDYWSVELIKTFKELGKNDAAIAGGKGASLGEMTQAGIPVPPGFVILADAFERFIEETLLVQKIEEILKEVDVEAMSTVDLASQKIQDLILTA